MAEESCSLISVRSDEIEPAVLDYLYSAFLDQPAFDEAVKRAMPSPEDHKRLEKERRETGKRLSKNQREIDRLVDAVAKGGCLSELLSKQDQLRAEKESLSKRQEELEWEIAAIPSVEETRRAAMLTRIALIEQHRGNDWRELRYDDIKRFLIHLFGESRRGASTGIFVRKDERGNIIADFKGKVDFYHNVAIGRPYLSGCAEVVDAIGDRINREYRRAVQAVNREYEEAVRAIEAERDRAFSQLRPSTANK